LLNEILSSPITKVDYVELDPLLIKLVKQYPTPLTERELADKRVKIINTDGRLFVRSAAEKYDVILVGLSKPQDLSVNRFFSREFFELTKKRLNPSGVFAICLPGSLSYLSQELKDVNASVINGLKQAYGYVRIIPGDYNMLIASESGTVMEVVPSLITQRLKERKIEPGILVPGYLDYRLSERWVDWFSQASVGATKEVNRDLRPIAVLEMMALWTKQFSPMTSFILGQAKKLNFVLPAIVILACSVMVGMFKNKRLVLAYGIAATGFFGMFANVALILAYQVRYGYLYYQIGVLVSLFMAGAAIGSLLMMRLMQKQDNHKLILWLEAGMIIFTLSLPALILSKIFMILFLIPGFFVGAQFPLAAKMYGKGEGEASGVLYGADLMGGWLAGMVGGIILLPVFGLWKMCLVMVMLKLSSLVLLLVERRG
jgi:spermidine synthase